LRVSVISFGSWITFGPQCDEASAEACMKAAHAAGVNFFDNAEVYGEGAAETFMGNIIKRNGWNRSELVISTKLFWGGSAVNSRGLSRKHIIEGTDASLKRLQLDYVDLLFCHRPDIHTPIEEIVRAMNHVIEKGKAFYWGTSEWSAEQISKAYLIAEKLGLIAPVMEQPQYNMLHRTRVEKEYATCIQEYGLGLTIWSPLASGLLSGKYSKNVEQFPKDSRLAMQKGKPVSMRNELLNGEGINGLEEKDFNVILAKVEQLKVVAAELGCTVAQLAIAWCVKNPNVSTVIIGASKVAQLEENVKSLDFVPLITGDVVLKIEKILGNKPSPVIDFRG